MDVKVANAHACYLLCHNNKDCGYWNFETKIARGLHINCHLRNLQCPNDIFDGSDDSEEFFDDYFARNCDCPVTNPGCLENEQIVEGKVCS